MLDNVVAMKINCAYTWRRLDTLGPFSFTQRRTFCSCTVLKFEGQSANPMILFVQAAGGPLPRKGESAGAEPSPGELSPGRRVGIPLQLHVQRGLVLVQGKLLTLDVPESAQPEGEVSDSVAKPRRGVGAEATDWSADDAAVGFLTTQQEGGDARSRGGEDSAVLGTSSGLENGVASASGGRPAGSGIHGEGSKDKSRAKVGVSGRSEGGDEPGSRIRLLELELWNGTDVVFEVAVESKSLEGRASGSDSESSLGRLFTHPPTRIDRDSSARVLIPLRGFSLPPGGRVPGTTAPPLGGGKQFVLQRSASGRQMTAAETAAAADFEAYVDALCGQISVRWQSGLNSTGELPVREAIREALQGPSLDALLPDVLGFTFRLAAGGSAQIILVACSGDHGTVLE